MKGARFLLCGMGLLGMFSLSLDPIHGQEQSSPYGSLHYSQVPHHSSVRTVKASVLVPPEDPSAAWRGAVARVMQQPTLTARCAGDTFSVNDELYRWMLDHPDRVALAWRRMHVPAIEIVPLGGGQFSWRDGDGSELIWRTVAQNADGRIWYAEGKFKPAPLLPFVPVRAVAILHHEVGRDPRGRTTISHRLEAFLQTDSRFAALVTRLMGPAGPKMAEEGAEQLLYFFSGVARYLDENPEKATKLLAERK
jgi:hypothetical protein